ncbi:S1 RNA-binding domain-containing protein [Shewanella intestini]|uniref:GntR family transcriptional regulator n=1 Tax=Shewanella intestini TaxID=2017544 RepID=A0ABS5I186_9GAMM|nr:MULTISPECIES: S1-like domain-containing RNA-binding protein [Shewanella]MBR9727786.1 GntR family transcriptional regulator [Shewanella intestini]MRG36221.1 GntR family transcriptional regulator [Shewanella sp. XMDDZSB0408]
MIQIGKRYPLEVVKEVSFGVYLNADELGQILLPKKYVPDNCEVGSKVDVFLYLDSDDVVIATTQKSLAQVGEFAFLKAVATNHVGAFLDWGLDKDLFLPFGEQKRPAEEGFSYLVYIHTNHVDDRIVASNKIDKFLDKTEPHYQQGEEVSLIIGGQTDLGYKAIVNNQHWGVIYKNEVFRKLRLGQKLTGFIKQVRSDGKIDLVLQKGSKTELDKHANLIMNKLNKAQGFLPLNDKTNADIIYEQLSMSKKAFKKSIGGLFKSGDIVIKPDGIYLK